MSGIVSWSLRGGIVALLGTAAIGTCVLGRAGPATTVVVPPAADGDRIVYPVSSPSHIDVPGGRRDVTSLLRVRGRMKYGDFVWKDVPGEAPVWVRVDLRSQTMSVFRGSDEIGSAVVMYGTDGKPTPTGSFPIIAKDADHRSSLYDADMPYALRLTGDGVFVHASDVKQGFATHGCIGIPIDFARRLFAVAGKSDMVHIIPRTPAVSGTGRLSAG